MSTVKYEKLVEEDLNVGTDMVWIHAPGGGELRSTQVGIHTFARGQKKYTTTWVPGLVAASGYVTTTVTVPDATVGDFVMASFTTMIGNHFTIAAHVSATDTVKVEIFNPTASGVTLSSGTLSVVVFPSITGAAPVPTPTATVSGSVYADTTPATYFPGVSVTMTVDGVAWPGGPATTDGDGAYTFLSVPAGAIVVNCSDATVMGAPYSGSNSGTCVPPTTLTLHIVMTSE